MAIIAGPVAKNAKTRGGKKMGTVIPNPYSRGTQRHRLLERLKEGPVTNKEIVLGLGIFNSTGRCSDLRKNVLEPIGLSLEAKRVKGALFEYRILGG
jgi:hypothetical protein